MIGRLAVALAIAAAGCGRQAAEGTKEIELVATREGAGEPFAMPFAAKKDGTGVVIDYLLRAKKEGARAASDLAIYVTGRKDGQAVSCRRDILVGPDAPAAAAASYPRLVTQEVTDEVYRCKPGDTPVTRTVTTYRQVRNPTAHQIQSIPETKEVTETAPTTCAMVAETHVATRYEHEIEAGFSPPALESLSPTYTRLVLHLGLPVCAPAAPGEPANRIAGTIYRR